MEKHTDRKIEATAPRFLPLRLSQSGMIITADGYGIAQTSGELISVNPIADAYWEDVPNGAEEVRALFALIVRAVNNHDALVGALEAGDAIQFSHNKRCPCDFCRQIARYRAARAKVQE